jgi:hypothetical protein
MIIQLTDKTRISPNSRSWALQYARADGAWDGPKYWDWLIEAATRAPQVDTELLAPETLELLESVRKGAAQAFAVVEEILGKKPIPVPEVRHKTLSYLGYPVEADRWNVIILDPRKKRREPWRYFANLQQAWASLLDQHLMDRDEVLTLSNPQHDLWTDLTARVTTESLAAREILDQPAR